MDSTPKYKILPESSYDITQTCPIHILEGQFKDIIYRYGKISFEEIKNNLNVHMEIEVIKAPDGFNKESPEFTKVVGDIFVDLVEDQVTSDVGDLEDDVHQDPLDKH
jgi:hypothetical protein